MVEDLQEGVDGLTEEIEAVDTQKKDILDNAKFPIKNLGLNENTVTYKGVPLKQCSASENLKISIAIAMALNPKFRVIRVTDASLLDKDNMNIINAMAKKKGFQVWMEVVSSGEEGVGICIE